MAERKKRLPIGIENFEEIRTEDYYYVDKTGLIADLLKSGGKVTLFTRPRRFGKTLNMSMLEAFFSLDSDKSMFEGLKISEETDLCEKYMGKYPVIFLSLKSLEGGSYAVTYSQMILLVNRLAAKVYRQVMHSDKLLSFEMRSLEALMGQEIAEADLFRSLCTLSEILRTHYGRKVVILIDEYDVPLSKAYEDGYYDEMIRLLRNLFHQALKTNDSLQFAVLTGCMRISKESIFTGLNNLKVRSISDEEFEEYFGFTDAEVREMMDYYGFPEYYADVRDWYDGYSFGQISVYCPWDVLCYCDKLRTDSDHTPENFWLNSSGNQAIRRLVRYGNAGSVKGEIEALLNGEVIEKVVQQNLTYPEMYASIENIWSVLYTTGYLTRRGRNVGNSIPLAIPNRELCNIFSEQILELFREDVQKDGEAVKVFCNALQERRVSAAEESLNRYLRSTISIRDAAVRRSLKENFYHGLLLGILAGKDGWTVTSNQESGNGYSDIQIRDWKNSLGIVIEVKYADGGRLEETCRKGLKQIDEKRYTDKMRGEQFRTILKYGMAFYLKECRVMLEVEE